MKKPRYPDDFKDWDGVDLPDDVINSIIAELVQHIENGAETPFVSSGNLLIEGDEYGIRICKIIKEWENDS